MRERGERAFEGETNDRQTRLAFPRSVRHVAGGPRKSNRYALRMPSKTSGSKSQEEKKINGLLGVGLDGIDGHKRVTKGDDFLLVGGSEQTHERLQELVMRMSEKLRSKGKCFRELSGGEFADLARESLE